MHPTQTLNEMKTEKQNLIDQLQAKYDSLEKDSTDNGISSYSSGFEAAITFLEELPDPNTAEMIREEMQREGDLERREYKEE